MKRKTARVEKASAGTMRAEGNKLRDVEREKLGEEFLKLYYAGDKSPKRI